MLSAFSPSKPCFGRDLMLWRSQNDAEAHFFGDKVSFLLTLAG
jgi:hypothetical protein